MCTHAHPYTHSKSACRLFGHCIALDSIDRTTCFLEPDRGCMEHAHQIPNVDLARFLSSSALIRTQQCWKTFRTQANLIQILFLKSVTLKPNSNLMTIAFTEKLRFIRFATRGALCTRIVTNVAQHICRCTKLCWQCQKVGRTVEALVIQLMVGSKVVLRRWV